MDLAKKRLRVRQTVQKIDGQLVLQEPKTEKSRRTIPFTSTVGNDFREIKKQQAQARLLKGDNCTDYGLAFRRKDGKMLDPAAVSKQFNLLAQKAGMQGVTFHSLRHTFASTLIAKGARLEDVQRLLGHDSPSTTMDIYHHLLPGALEATVALLEE